MDDDERARLKREAAEAALAYVKADTVVGVGTGSTAGYFVAALKRERPRISAAVPSSVRTAALLRDAGIDVRQIDDVPAIDLYVDGADKVDPQLRLIKGAGGAHTREKIVASAARLFVCIVDVSKLVRSLEGATVPLEVLPGATRFVSRRVAAMGGTTLQRADTLTDDGNPILDAMGLDLGDPEPLESRLGAIPGVVESGLFALRPADVVLCAAAEGVRVLTHPLLD